MERIDFSDFGPKDVADIALQRTRHLKRWPVVGSISFRQWLKGNRHPLQREAVSRRDAILTGAINDIAAEFAQLAAYLGERSMDRIVDIGCGHALVDLFFWRKYRCDIHLVDIEETREAHHDYHNAGAGYASLTAARRFLETNGVPGSSIRTTNPKHEPLHDARVDVILSMLSAGFHYPISTYTGFALGALNPGGCLVFDMRRDTGQADMLGGFARIDTLFEHPRYTRVAAVKP